MTHAEDKRDETPAPTEFDLTNAAQEARAGGAAPPSGRYAAGDLVADRFRVARFIAQGGMGEVYEAEDLVLRTRVALKTIRLDRTRTPEVVERFKREVQLARQVTHPNVCRLFDLFQDRRAGGRPEDEVLFLTMELLTGETLTERLQRGRMPTSEALPIVRQLAAALAAAHEAGVIHRDFKSQNVMLTAGRESSGEPRAVVTDFGLARAGGMLSNADVTRAGVMLGTPAYMAPEQVEGGPLTAATDIYAFGCVMYEMATGRPPFEGDSPLAVAIKRLHERPSPPRALARDVDPVWERVILRCLERDPARRIARAEEVSAALSQPPMAPRRRPSRAAILATALGVMLAVLLAVLLARALRQGAGGAPAAPSAANPEMARKARRTVVVLAPQNLSGRAEAAWLSAALAEMLRTELAAGETLRLLPGETVARMGTDLALSDTNELAADTLRRVRARAGADVVVAGAYVALKDDSGGQIRLDLRVQDAAAGETIASVAETGTERELLDLVARAGSRLRESLGVRRPSAAEADAVRAALPSSPEAARPYAEGLERLRRFDALGARGRLEEAARADPAHPLPHAALAAAWTALGYDVKAKDEARKAMELSAKLPREERLWVEARYREANHEWERASEIYRTLVGFFPDNLEYGLRLADAQVEAGKAKDALGTVDGLHRLLPPASQDPRIDLAEARAAHAISDFQRERMASERGLASADAQGAGLVAAQASLYRGDAAWSLGDPQKALAAYERARQAFGAAGDRGGVARALQSRGVVLYRLGQYTAARSAFTEVLAIHRETGSERGVATSLNNLGNVAVDEGDLVEARRLYEQSLAGMRRTGDLRNVAGGLGNIANVLQYQGDLAGAQARHEEALAIFRGLGERNGVAIEQNNIAVLLAARGELAAARKLFEEALAIKRETRNRSSIAFTLSDLGGLLETQGDLRGARRCQEEAVAIRRELKQDIRAAQSQLSLAELDLDEGHAAAAEETIREAERALAAETGDVRGPALLLLARCLLAEGKPVEARAVVEQARAALEKSQDASLRIALTAVAGRVLAGSGDPATAAATLPELEAALAEASRMRHMALQFEMRLALGAAELAGGRGPSGRGRLSALAAEARAKGFALVSQKASALLQGSRSPS